MAEYPEQSNYDMKQRTSLQKDLVRVILKIVIEFQALCHLWVPRKRELNVLSDIS